MDRRTAAAIELIEDTFERAKDERDGAVVLLAQADMFLPDESPPSDSYRYAFQPIVATIAREARAFNGPVNRRAGGQPDSDHRRGTRPS